ncbi:histidine phosphatase family protein [Loktanella sp. F6476L]|uniref:histidine phosphatase family protein n=1 Tax=Loktanella sp. F6476L TaxID=2926405 RepID=UPI001FF3201C|nr:histidine phosphatase family protein [Loktanella sp. F6476L]MCK0121848.1 histidine phosphatase family protein [Loktanella sp. F6476L]UWR00012.1 histidine phosphatase family protein [Rhodobacteraceae bacterium S2214]
MGEITLVRHGQANSAADNEIDYDKLSELGHQQAKWLGEWIHAHDGPFDAIFSGSLRRQKETAAGMGFTDVTVDERLNEIAYYDLTDEMAAHQPETTRTSPEDFVTHFPATLSAWKDGHIKGTETYQDFTDRVQAVMDMAAQPGRRILCVTSGGIIAQSVSRILGLDIPQMARIALPILNTSVHRIHVTDHGPLVSTFNSSPHLDHADRLTARTHY